MSNNKNKITISCENEQTGKSLHKWLYQFNKIFGFTLEYGTYEQEGIAKNEINGAEYCWEFISEQNKLVICTNNKFRENNDYLAIINQMQQLFNNT